MGAGTALNEVANNFLTHQQLKGFSDKLKQCNAQNSCEQVIKEMADLNYAQQEELNALCSTDPVACINKYAFIAAEEKLFMEEISNLREGNISARISSVLGILRLEQVDAYDMVNDAAFNLALSSETGLSPEAAKALSVMAAALAGKVSVKAGKGSAMPVPQSTKAENGLDYASNPKHTSGTGSNLPSAGIEPSNSLSLFGSSITSSEKVKQRYALDSEGNVHRFSWDNVSTWHWSGSTGDAKNALKKNVIPNDVRKQFNLPGKW